MISRLLIPLVVLGLVGCEEVKVYTQHLTQKELLGVCLTVNTLDPKLTKPLKGLFGVTQNPHCPFRITGFIHHNSGCNNPQSLFPSPKDGYVSIQIVEGNTTHYRIQANFESDEEGAIEQVVEELRKSIVGR